MIPLLQLSKLNSLGFHFIPFLLHFPTQAMRFFITSLECPISCSPPDIFIRTIVSSHFVVRHPRLRRCRKSMYKISYQRALLSLCHNFPTTNDYQSQHLDFKTSSPSFNTIEFQQFQTMPSEDDSAAGPSSSTGATANQNTNTTSTSQPTHKSSHSHSHSFASEPRVPFLPWFLVGGTGRPPKESNFLRMAHERNEAGRRAEAFQEARKEALDERSKYLADWEKKWGPAGGAGLLSKTCGHNKK
ncbi:hypothetical protein F4805DRAFT_430488 [Annulohypoxylon moriforme]|nr:hypothetical protein F4805DRAFT_430488 [Annulohypoxylon moriforme]